MLRFLSLCTLLAPAQAEEPPPAAAPQAQLTLSTWLDRFLQADPSWRVAALERDVAELQLRWAQDPATLTLEGSPAAGFDELLYDAGDPEALMSFSAADLEASWANKKGGVLSAQAATVLSSQPELADGSQLGLGVSYALPLAYNAMGRLHALEAAWREREREARSAELQAHLLGQCAAASELYLAAWVAQEQAATWQDLLLHKEKTFKTAKHDWARRMIPRLDVLAAESDWIAAQQRAAQLDAARQEALAVLAVYLGGEAGALESPGDALRTWTAAGPEALESQLEAHPALRIWEEAGLAYASQSAYAEHSYAPQVYLAPGFGVTRYGFGEVASGPSSLVDLGAWVGLSFSLPLVQPAPEYETAILAERQRQAEAEAEELRRALRERAAVARAALAGVAARRALSDQKLAVIEKQIAEAGAAFANGRLEFQDYLQHWAAYEAARFEALELDALDGAARADLLRALGPLPPSCQPSATH